jgi:hypothetical protein
MTRLTRAVAMALWPPYRRRQQALDAWCEAHRGQIAEFARRVAQLGYTIGSGR